jgi:hypothetical protein
VQADLVVGRAKGRIQAKAFSVSWAGPPTKPLTQTVGQCLAKAKSALFGSFDPRPKIVCKKHKDKE